MCRKKWFIVLRRAEKENPMRRNNEMKGAIVEGYTNGKKGRRVRKRKEWVE
ncbi:hypothetical protein SESBI_40389 [Sesbania bispinosa]|nr:hypothetical protein SESBI_40389 [Sesbania bispinosa]